MSDNDGTQDVEEEPGEGSPAAGGCVIALGIGLPLAGVYAASAAAGVLTAWAVGITALWHVARRHRVSDSSAPPPPGESRPSCSECAGHALVSVTALEGQKGMMIFKSAPPDRPNHTHVHLVRR